MDDFLCLPEWNGAAVSRTKDALPEDQRPVLRVTQPLPVDALIPEKTPYQRAAEKPDPKVVSAKEKKEALAAADAGVKRSGAESGGGVRIKPSKKNQSQATSTSDGTLSISAASKLPITPNEEDASSTPTEKKSRRTHGAPRDEVVEVSDNTRVSTPPVVVTTVYPTPERVGASGGDSIHSPLPDDEEGLEGDRFVPEWVLRADMRFSSARACKELVSHLSTPIEDEYLSHLSNMDLVRRAYQSLGKCVLTQGELLKRHEQMNSAHVTLRNQNDVRMSELLRLRTDLQKEVKKGDGLHKELLALQAEHASCPDQVEIERERDEWRRVVSEQEDKIKTMEEEAEPKARALAAAEARVMMLEKELAAKEFERKGVIREVIPVVLKKLLSSVEYRRSIAVPVSLCYTAGWLGGVGVDRTEEKLAEILATTQNLDIEGSKSWKTKHQELFETEYSFISKVAASSHLSVSELLELAPDTSAPGGAGP